MIGLSIAYADITKDANGVATDSLTRLEWQDDEVGSEMKWGEAINHCDSLILDGSGWRLPNINELKSIVDRSKVDPAIANGFQNNISSYYWSSSTYVKSKGVAWTVGFYGCDVVDRSKDGNRYVRCVRNGQ